MRQQSEQTWAHYLVAVLGDLTDLEIHERSSFSRTHSRSAHNPKDGLSKLTGTTSKSYSLLLIFVNIGIIILILLN